MIIFFMAEEVFALEDRSGTEKKKARYSVQIVSDGDLGRDKLFSAGLGVLVAFVAAVALLVIAALSYCFILAGDLKQSGQNIQELEARIETLVKQNEELLMEEESLVRENDELQETVEILSHTINGKVQQEQEREAKIAKTYIPTGFPLKGTASYNENDTELDGNAIAMFSASPGTSVVATANGTVSSIASEAGVGYIVTVDHGNGYLSVYRNGARPKVKEGDTVTNTTELFDIETGKEVLGYQIIENEEYINPLSLMETYG